MSKKFVISSTPQMLRCKFITALITLMFLAGYGLSQRSNTSSNQERVRSFTWAKAGPNEDVPSHFEFSTPGYSYRVLNDGRSTQRGGRPLVRSFNLRLKKDEIIEHLSFATIGSDLLLICETYLDVGVAGFITRLDGSNLKMKWKLRIPAFNIGQGLIEITTPI